MIKKLLYPIIDLVSFRQLRHVKFFCNKEGESISSLKEFQLFKLNELSLRLGIKIESWDDFYDLPITEKKDLPAKPRFAEKTKQHETSGSTGQPRTIWVPVDSWARKDAIFTRSWKNMGRKFSDRVFRLISGEPQYPIYDWFRNVKAMNYKTIGQSHVDWVVKNKPFLIHGPGGAIRQLCELIIDAGHEEVLRDIKIHWCSESSFGHKDRLQPLVKEFHEQYGLAELPTVAATDGFGNLRVVMEQGVVEIVDDFGNPTQDGQEGFIVVTDFNNYQTPILRYKCGDRGKIKLSDDGRYYILYDIIGRGVDYYSGPEVKRAIGWWVVAPLSHLSGQPIKKWRCEINIPRRTLILHLQFKDAKNWESLNPYRDWVMENLGLATEYIESQDEKYDILWKNKLVRVIV